VTLLQGAAQPIVVRVVEQPVHDTSIADVIIGAIGLTGFLLLTAALLGALLGGILIGVKLLRARNNLEPMSDSEVLHIT
jgi:hypothetical protein